MIRLPKYLDERLMETKTTDTASIQEDSPVTIREGSVPEPERYEKLLEEFRPQISIKHFGELLQELEGKTPEEKEQIIVEAMEELTATMSYY